MKSVFIFFPCENKKNAVKTRFKRKLQNRVYLIHFFQVCTSFSIAFISFCILTAILANDELRKITMYPIALLSSIDFITNLYAIPMIQFEIHLGRYDLHVNDNNFPYKQFVNAIYESRDLFFDLFDKPYKLMLTLGYLFGNHLFILSCVPWFILHRLTEYFYGPILSLVAVERYIMTCRPFDAKRLLTDPNRKRVLVILTVSLLTISLVDCVVRYKLGQFYWFCTTGYASNNYLGVVTSVIFL